LWRAPAALALAPAALAPGGPAVPPPQAGRPSHRLVVTRLFDGDVAGLRLGEADLLELARSVLRFLRVLHSNGMLHMDIKPTNVLRRRLPGKPRYEFCVADYNLLLETPAVQALLAPGPPEREFQSMSHGTPGFMSPLLLRDEGDQNLYASFERVARAMGVRPPPVGADSQPARVAAFWRGYFDAQRRGGRVAPAKVDLHSLALTLLRMSEHLSGHLSKPLSPSPSPPGRLLTFVSKLMFFGADDFADADAALAGLPPPPLAGRSKRVGA
jgi:serine/threonine protein kinase